MSQDSETARVLGLVHGQVCYLELPAADGARASAFYAAVFGWDTEEHAPDFVAPGLIGQWLPGRPPAPDAGPMLWLHVSDMDESLKRVTAHGGEILESPSPDGPERTLATILDPEGNPIGLASHTQPPIRLSCAVTPRRTGVTAHDKAARFRFRRNGHREAALRFCGYM